MTDGPLLKPLRLKERLENICAEMIEKGILLPEAVAQFEKYFILEYLKRGDGNLTRAAVGLCLHRNTLAKKVQVYKLRKSG